MTPSQIAEALAAQADKVARELLPNGKRQGNEWEVGSVDGDAGKSMKVCISGDKAGVWCDFATGESGDLLDLWREVRQITAAEAITQTKSYLGVMEPQFFDKTAKRPSFAKPARPKCSPNAPEMDWLKSRGLSDKTLSAYRVAGSGGKVYFPFIRNSETVMIKWRSISDKTTAPTSKNQEPILFGWQAIPEEAREVTICEGEIDAMSMYEMGIPALSVPFGGGTGGKQQWIENEFENLERFDKIYICMDMDEVGKAAAQEIIERLGSHRCRYVNLPAKDANDCLKEGVPPKLVHDALHRAVTLDPSELRPASTYAEEAYYEIFPEERPVQEDVLYLPANKGAEDFQIRLGELVLATGVNGHGKSEYLGHFIVDGIRQGMKWCIASMELPPGRLLGRMTRQAAGMEKPTKDYQDAIFEWYEGRLWLFDVQGHAKSSRILEVFEYAFKRYGIKHFLIDSLMKCGIADDDYAGQKAFIDTLCDFKNKFNVTVVIVAHSKKMHSEHEIAGKFEVLGASAITNLIDSGFTVWRNKNKEEIVAGERESDATEDEVKGMPDCKIWVWKQRNGSGWEGRLNHWFDKGSRQYRPAPDSKPFQYVQFSKSGVKSA